MSASIKKHVHFPTRGISGTLYTIIWWSLMVLVFAIAQYVLAPSTHVVTETFGNIPGWIGEYFIRLGIVIGIVFVRAWVIFYHVLDTPIRQIKREFESPRNDSHAIILGGLIFLTLALIVSIKGASFDQYLYGIMTRGALGEIVGDCITILIARFVFSIHNMDEFRDWVTMKDNNSHVIMVVVVKIATLILALAS